MAMNSKKAWAWAWTGWAIAVGGSFAWLESAALRKKSHPTFSTTLRRVLGVYPRTPWGRLAIGGFACFWTWLVVHIAHAPDDVFHGTKPPPGTWIEVSPKMWYREPRRHGLI